MGKMKLFNIISALTLVALCCANSVFSSPMNIHVDPMWGSDFRPYGGYVDEVIFQVYPDDNKIEALIALREGNLDMCDFSIGFDIDFLPGLLTDPNVDVDFSLASRIRYLALNCGEFPTNITGYRRALAIALDKVKINEEANGGAGVPIDSHMPLVATEWEIESSLPVHYYSPDIASGNATLEKAGFRDLDGDGWREYDVDDSGTWTTGDLDDYDCETDIYATNDFYPSVITSQYAYMALEDMGLRVQFFEKDWQEIVNDMVNANYNITCMSMGVPPDNPYENLELEFRSSIFNLYSFSNSTIDAAIDDMMSAPTLGEAKMTSTEVLQLLAYEMPIIPIYNDVYFSAYRTDIFEGLFNFLGQGKCYDNPYSITNVHLKLSEGAPFGGTFRCGGFQEFQTTNILNANYADTLEIFNYIYEGLWSVDPNTWDPIPQLAYDWTIEETTAGGGIQDGQKFTFHLYHNATWHNGDPVNAADVEYSFETIWPRSPQQGWRLANIYRVDSPDDYTVEIYSNRSGYQEWIISTNLPVLPRNIWDSHGPDFENWIPATSTHMTGSGPYKWVGSVPDMYTTLTRHPEWHFSVNPPEEPTTTTEEPTTSTTTPTTTTEEPTTPTTTPTTTTEEPTTPTTTPTTTAEESTTPTSTPPTTPTKTVTKTKTKTTTTDTESASIPSPGPGFEFPLIMLVLISGIVLKRRLYRK
ncbi:MAG: ABC transporter substrate-binding protein [Promethearchaeota archaeon]